MKAPYDYEAPCPDCEEERIADWIASEVEDQYGENATEEQIKEIQADILSECKLCYSCYKANHYDD